MSDEVDIELDDEESGDDEVSSVKKVKPVKAPVDKLKEEFEDLAVSSFRFASICKYSSSSNNRVPWPVITIFVSSALCSSG